MKRRDELPEFDPDQDLDAANANADELEPPAPPAPPAPTAARPPGFSYNNRLYALGFSGSGKSEVLNVLFSAIKCRRILIDTKPEFSILDVDPVSDPSQIDWAERTIHYQPEAGSDCSQYEELFSMCCQLRGIVVCIHEFGALVDYNANRAGRFLISYISQGRSKGQGLLAGTQRPRMVPVSGMTEANHVLVFVPQLARREDNEAAADAVSPVEGEPMDRHELVGELAALKAEHGEHSFLWKDRNAGTMHAIPPLPEQLRARNIVQRTEDA